MALKTGEKVDPTAQTAPPVPTTVLELALYKQYTWKDVTYEKGKPYRFRNADAMVLLAEQDAGRPVWKLYQAPKPRQAPPNEVVDSTNVQVEGAEGTSSAKRINIGDESEIKELLGGDVTV